MPDAHFEVRRLAEIYDPLDPDRSDLEVYADLIDELGAASVVDVGCGTGTFACMLALRGLAVVGVDPAEASIVVARRKPGAERVRWQIGDVTAVRGSRADAVTMTGNVAQVFIDDAEWDVTLREVRSMLAPEGALVFEVRDPDREGWTEWTRERSFRRTDIPGVGVVQTWVDLTEVRPPLVSFRSTFRFEADGTCLTSDSTLRFRSRAEIEQALDEAGFAVADRRDAPDRPGRELVFIARPTSLSYARPVPPAATGTGHG